MLPEGKCRYIDGQIYPDGNFYVLDTQHIKHNGNELKSALNGISTDISNKVDKETGKGLSTNDYTTAEKNKLSGIEANANNYVHPTTSGNKHIPSGGSSGKILGWSADGTASWVDPASGGGSVDTVYIGSTEYAPDANGKVTLPTYPTTLPASDVYSWAKASSKPSYTASEVGAVPTTRIINSKPLSSDIVLSATDISLNNYSKPSSGDRIGSSDTIQNAIGKIDNRLGTGQFFYDSTNRTTFTFKLVKDSNSNSHYRYGMFMTGTENTAPSLFSIFVDTSNNVTIAKMSGNSSATYTGSLSWNSNVGTLTLTASFTIYGGIRGIWFN